jgi:hypothetical protein
MYRELAADTVIWPNTVLTKKLVKILHEIFIHNSSEKDFLFGILFLSSQY